MSLPENLNQLDLNIFNPSWPFFTCSKSFLLEVSLLYDSFFCWGRGTIRFAPICYKILHTVFERSLCTIALSMPIICTPFGIPSHFSSIGVWSHWQNLSSNLSLLKLAFKFLIPLVNLDIVLTVHSWILRSKSTTWGLIKALRVYSV